ncbi:putative malate dehydrogenase 1B isoform X2 [Rhinatrema bivittatum]|uniref:putative malate dehydrogenase 1B isoform X2 n=1 Tax=Rhinatrema bivittatum TaxID=194408 RepID=UPI00112AF31D|nr:putative malate dehydrogenase 1B isoform X2 [Rhinatrema bivittatum]
MPRRLGCRGVMLLSNGRDLPLYIDFMAKFVLAGRADCPYYAKAEALADFLKESLDNFRIHKITQHPDDWEHWLEDIREKNGWEHKSSPIIWRELLDRGGKGLLLGGFNEFMEHAQHYYGITPDMISGKMKIIASENLKTHIKIQKEQKEFQSLIKPFQVWISSASEPACYNLIPILASGKVFGMSIEISINLLDNDDNMEVLQGLMMEAQDLAFPLLRNVSVHSISDEAFLKADVIIVLDDFFPRMGQTHRECKKQMAKQCKKYGELIERNANREVKVIVAGRTFVNLKTFLILQHVPSIEKYNVVALASELEWKAKAQLARKLGMSAAEVKDVIVWGNISGMSHLDLKIAKVYKYDGAIWGPGNFSHPMLDVIYDRKWLMEDYFSECILWRQHHSGMLAAHTMASVLNYWFQDSPPGELVSLGVISEGQFGIPKEIIFSMPVTFQEGKWKVFSEMDTKDIQENLAKAASELITISKKMIK